MTERERQLPRPSNSTDIYLSAILDALMNVTAAINAKCEVPKPQEIEQDEKETVLLKEPVALKIGLPMTIDIGLPTDFPAREKLETAGISRIEDVPLDIKHLVAIPGIGAATAKRILEELDIGGD